MKTRITLLPPVLALLLLLLAAAGCRREEEPTPTPPPTATTPAVATQPPAATTAPESDDAVWQRIRERGRIVVGTSADYPPFEYYTPDFRLTGFDIALMQEIGGQLGLPVEFRDMSFEALADAVVAGQIDLAVSAISATEERAQFVDFSNIYFVGTDAVLMRSDVTGVTLTEVDDLAGARVGVQRLTVFEQLVNEALVESGLTDPRNIFAYADADQAVAALGDRQVDFVMLDLQPAEAAVAAGDFVIAAQGLNLQRLAFAAPKGSPELIANLNRALEQVKLSGRMDELAQEYLGLSRLPEIVDPTPPEGPDEPEEPEACVDLMQFVEDVTFPDNNMQSPAQMAPGQTFDKVWRLRNTGSCTWSTQYNVAFVAGNSPLAAMGGQTTFLPTEVPPGNTVDVSVRLTAPLAGGTYQGIWELRNPVGQGIGDRFWVGITVPAAPTPTPPPTATASPTVSFTVDQNVIQQGQCTTLRWDVQNVQAVFLYPVGEDWRNFPVTGQGTREVCPAQTTTYELRVVNTNGSVELRQLRVDVIPVAGAPEIRRFTVDPPFQIFTGQCVVVAWQVLGAVDTVQITRNGSSLMNPAPFSGSMQDCPPAGEQIYRITASGPGGLSNNQQIIQVITPTAEPPTATPVPPNPPAVITTFSVTPNQIQVNQCVNIFWNTTGGVTNVRILRDGNVVLDNASFNGQTQDCHTNPGNVTYTIEARNASGEGVSRSAQVTVTDNTPQNPLADSNWQLVRLNQIGIPLGDTTLTAFFGADGSIAVNGGCNTGHGSYTVSGNNITIGPLATGQLFCSEEVNAQEAAYLAALQAAVRFELTGDALVLFDAGGLEVLRFAGL